MLSIRYNVFDQREGTPGPREIGANNQHAGADGNRADFPNKNGRPVMPKHMAQSLGGDGL